MILYKNILITGGTGSLGTALLQRSVDEQWNTEITIVARNETKMNQTLLRFPHVRGEIGDVRDRDWLTTIFPGHDAIVHAAAIKIVPVAEANPREAVLTNVMGSMNVAQAAIESGVGRVVGISTDKACGPTYYGLTKRLMEGIFRQARKWGDTEFVLCRYGNVIGSANSVVPFFQKQIRDDVPFTITDPQMTRFWLSMRQAVDIVLDTLETIPRHNGTILVPRAPAMSVFEVAKTLDPEREIKIIGIRPGERLHETLIVQEEALHTTRTEKYFIVDPPEVSVIKPMPQGFEYRSDNPDRLLTSVAFRKLMDES